MKTRMNTDLQTPMQTHRHSLKFSWKMSSAFALCFFASLPALAQNHHHGHAMPAAHQEPEVAMPEVGHAGHDSHAGHAPSATEVEAPAAQPAQHESADDLRDPHAYADGYVRGSGPYALTRYHLGDEHPYATLLVDRLDWGKAAAGKPSLQFDGQWSWGSSYNRLLLQSEGHAENGKLQEASNEVLWSRAIAPFWDSHLGIRLDKNEGANRQWLAFGVQGLAPYWFEVHAKAYLGEGGRSALRLGGDYDLALSQRLFLQPSIETNFYGKSDLANGLGSGLSSASASLLLRYEWQRELAPYVGVERQKTFGQTADIARSLGQKTGQTRWFAGVRFWF
ncbi:MAG: copper resistance protein B [Brachymonas sp.]